MQKRTYYIPTIEIMVLSPELVMQDNFSLNTSDSMGDANTQAPARREPGDLKSY